MKKTTLFIALGIVSVAITVFYFTMNSAEAQEIMYMKKTINMKMIKTATTNASKVDFDAFEKLTKEVKEYRKNRLLDLETYLKTSKEKGVIILDTRSEAMFKAKHVKGAINLNFSDFTQNNLARIIPSFDTKILIYCNNNFDNDEIYFVSKSVRPEPTQSMKMQADKELTLALNIPTFINLYGYGYKNVCELSELISVFDSRVQFEGTSVDVITKGVGQY